MKLSNNAGVSLGVIAIGGLMFAIPFVLRSNYVRIFFFILVVFYDSVKFHIN
jgi:hypothetical protein